MTCPHCILQIHWFQGSCEKYRFDTHYFVSNSVGQNHQSSDLLEWIELLEWSEWSEWSDSSMSHQCSHQTKPWFNFQRLGRLGISVHICIRSNLTTLASYLDDDVWGWRINNTDMWTIGTAKTMGNQLKRGELPDIATPTQPIHLQPALSIYKFFSQK